MSEQPSLMPCPFCGGEAKLERRNVFDRSPLWWIVKCDGECGSEYRGPNSTKEEALYNWNDRRVIPPCSCGGQAVLGCGEKYEQSHDEDSSRRVIRCVVCDKRATCHYGEEKDGASMTGIDMSDRCLERWIAMNRRAPLAAAGEGERKFSDAMFAYHDAERGFESKLVDAGFDFGSIRGDDYDNSIEFDDVPPDQRMSDGAQRIVYEAGFSKAYVNHTDKWETHYTFDRSKPFASSRGWRRLERPGGFDISYWPEGWGDPETGKCAEWLRSGYMKIVPEQREGGA